MSKNYKSLDRDDLLKSFLSYKDTVDREYKDGRLTREQACRLINTAKHNYKRQNYNRMVERINAT